jgi:hypothetical protein
MRRIIVSLALALTLVSALILPAAAAEQRPVRGEFTGSGVAADQRCGPDALTLGFVITGVASHLGRLTGSGTNCTEFTLGTQAVPIWDGIVTLEAADGSTLTASYEGRQGAPEAGVATFLHTDTILGGTGRFEGATGAWTIAGVIDLANLTVSGSVAGWLDY